MAKFIKIKCNCGNVQIVFETASMEVKCRKCNEVIALPTGGKIAIKGTYVGDVE